MPLLGKAEKGQLEEMILGKLQAHFDEHGPAAMLDEKLRVVVESKGAFLDAGETPDPLAAVVTEHRRAQLTNAIDRLPKKERLVLILYYCEELTMKEIGKILTVTESRVCQLHTKAILSLKAMLHEAE